MMVLNVRAELPSSKHNLVLQHYCSQTIAHVVEKTLDTTNAVVDVSDCIFVVVVTSDGKFLCVRVTVGPRVSNVSNIHRGSAVIEKWTPNLVPMQLPLDGDIR